MKISSLKDLENISKKIKKKILPGDCIFLYGEIGVGKTTFSRILINNFEKDESVTLKDENFLHEQIEYSEFLIDIENKTSKEISEKHIKNLDKTTNLLIVLDKAFVENNFEEMWECLSKLRFYLKHGKELSKVTGEM